ncbi:hypothetical protein ACET9N_20175 [Aeromonas veronii]
MTTTAAGDVAVARLNKATEAFEKIITGASNQVVDVPGYGNQPTLAARVDQRLDEITATAAEEADRSRDEADRATTQATSAANSVTLSTAEYNKAKTQADRAQNEADRAAQITGLSTVSDAIGLASLPLPDVWAPLSDSLRMITGYGRDVLVGSDVVARMVNFSRNSTKTYRAKDGTLKTAAVNEPAFEAEGLLFEGQSTNYIVQSEGLAQLAPEPDSVVVVESGVTLVKYVGTGALAKDCTAPANTVLTLSFFVKLGATDTVITFQTRDGSFTGRTAIFRVKPTGELVVTNSQSLLSSWSVVKVSHTLVRIIGTTISSDSTIYRAYRGDPVANETFGSFQLEALPFASSYIPTNGAAATRAQDLAWLPAYGNQPFGLVMSIAAEVDLIGKGLSSWPRPYELNDSENKGGHIVMASGSWDGADLVGRKTTISLRFSDRSHWASGAKRPSQWNGYLNQLYTGNIYLFGTTNPARAFYGHVRNIRAWFVPLSDDQHKAIK